MRVLSDLQKQLGCERVRLNHHSHCGERVRHVLHTLLPVMRLIISEFRNQKGDQRMNSPAELTDTEVQEVLKCCAKEGAYFRSACVFIKVKW